MFCSAMAAVSCFGLCRMDVTVGPWIPLAWLQMSLCYSVSSVQEHAFGVIPCGSLCWGILGNMSWIPFRSNKIGRCSSSMLLALNQAQDQDEAGLKQNRQLAMPTWVMWVLHLQHQLTFSVWMCFSCTALFAEVDIETKTAAKVDPSTWSLSFLLTSGAAS